MTADSGKRLTCIIPTDSGMEMTDDDEKESKTENTENTENAPITPSESNVNPTSTDTDTDTDFEYPPSNKKPDDPDPLMSDGSESSDSTLDLIDIDTQFTELFRDLFTDDEFENIFNHIGIDKLVEIMDSKHARERFLMQQLSDKESVETGDTATTKRKRGRKNRENSNPNCFYSKEGYWSYEVCLYGAISQYHGNKNKRDPELGLGSYVNYVDPEKIVNGDEDYEYLYLRDIYGLELFRDDTITGSDNADDAVEKNQNQNQNQNQNFLHLLYTGGEAKRESLVTIQCSESPKNTKQRRIKDGIYKLDEPKLHHYHFVIALKSVCDYIPWLKQEYGIDHIGETQPASSSSSLFNSGGNGAQSSTGDDGVFHRHLSDGDSSSAQLLKRGIDPQSEDVSLLLSPLLDLAKENRCLLLKQGWWTVEFCYGRFIRQIHLEAKRGRDAEGNIVQSLSEWDIKQEHITGRWDDTKEITSDSFVIHKNGNDPARTYASIIYSNGDECDLTKEPRFTEIQFRCGPNRENSELVKSREDPSCEYIAQIETPLLCEHPDFKIPSAPNYEIVCYPFDAQEFGDAASSMKAVADVQSATDPILNLVTNAAKEVNGMNSDNENEESGTIPTSGKREL